MMQSFGRLFFIITIKNGLLLSLEEKNFFLLHAFKVFKSKFKKHTMLLSNDSSHFQSVGLNDFVYLFGVFLVF